MKPLMFESDEQKVFREVLESVSNRYNLRIENPYNDSYIEIYRGNTNLGGMNYGGYSLLYNIGKLYEICKGLL